MRAHTHARARPERLDRERAVAPLTERAQAKTSIYLETYTLEDDAVGRKTVELLADAQNRGERRLATRSRAARRERPFSPPQASP